MVRYRLLLVNALLLFALGASLWGRHRENAQPAPTDLLRGLSLPYRDWKATELSVSAGELALLQPDSTLARRYDAPGGESLELTVIAGHRKRTVHLPAYCMTGSGWDTLAQQDVSLPLGGKRSLPAARVLMAQHGQQILVTYCFTDGDFTTRSLTAFQAQQLMRRFRSAPAPGALVRLITPVGTGPEAPSRAAQQTDAFAAAVLPALLERLRSARP